MFVVCKSCAVYIVNPAALFFAAKKSKSKMDILHSFSPFFTPQDWFDAPCFMICNKTAISVAQRAKKTEKDLCGIFLNNCDILVVVRLVSYTKKEIFMKDIYISGFADEISSSFDEQLKTVRELGMQIGRASCRERP